MCCDTTLHYVQDKYDYLVFLTMLLSIIGFLNYTTLVSLITFLQIYIKNKLDHGKFERLLAILTIIIPIAAIIYA